MVVYGVNCRGVGDGGDGLGLAAGEDLVCVLGHGHGNLYRQVGDGVIEFRRAPCNVG